jgi:hypothetical protein
MGEVVFPAGKKLSRENRRNRTGVYLTKGKVSGTMPLECGGTGCGVGLLLAATGVFPVTHSGRIFVDAGTGLPQGLSRYSFA